MISWFTGRDGDGTTLPMPLPRFVILMLGATVVVGIGTYIAAQSVLIAFCVAAATAAGMQVVYFALVARYIATKRREADAYASPVSKHEQAKTFALSPKITNR